MFFNPAKNSLRCNFHHIRVCQAKLRTMSLPLSFDHGEIFGMGFEIFFRRHKPIKRVHKGIDFIAAAEGIRDRDSAWIQAIMNRPVRIIGFAIPSFPVFKARFLPVFNTCNSD